MPSWKCSKQRTGKWVCRVSVRTMRLTGCMEYSDLQVFIMPESILDDLCRLVVHAGRQRCVVLFLSCDKHGGRRREACDMPRHSSRRGQLEHATSATDSIQRSAGWPLADQRARGPCRTGGQDRASSALLRMLMRTDQGIHINSPC